MSTLPVRALRPGPYFLNKPVKNERPDRRCLIGEATPD